MVFPFKGKIIEGKYYSAVCRNEGSLPREKLNRWKYGVKIVGLAQHGFVVLIRDSFLFNRLFWTFLTRAFQFDELDV